MFTIKANSPEETRSHIVKWLRDQAINHSVGMRMAERARVRDEHRNKSAAYTSAADFIELIKIESLPTSTMINIDIDKCPDCGSIGTCKQGCPSRLF